MQHEKTVELVGIKAGCNHGFKSINDGEQWAYLLNGWDNRDVTNNRIYKFTIQ